MLQRITEQQADDVSWCVIKFVNEQPKEQSRLSDSESQSQTIVTAPWAAGLRERY